GAAPELLSDGIGILVKPEDPEDMAEAIVKICQMSQEHWRQMSDRAYTKATSYTWDDAAQLCEQAFEIALRS
ncbi:MAG: glycosyltransferase, partial [Planktothrix sp.]